MTPTQMARFSDDLYHGRVSRRTLCDMVAHRDDEIERLRAMVEERDTAGVLKVQLDELAFMPERAHATDAGADLRTPMAFVLHSGCSHVVDTGVHVELPHGTVGLLKSKSGLHVLHGITSEGVIDEGYSGSIRVRLQNDGPKAHLFHAGDKITQLVVVPVLYAGFERVEAIEGGERGSDGFGSTGK